MKLNPLAGLAAVLAITVLLAADAFAQGWLSRATGGRVKTPTPIRKIAPNGISIRPRESQSSIQVVTPPYIDANGNVYSGSGSGGSGGRYVGKAYVWRNAQGQAYYRSNYSNIYGRPRPRRVPRLDRSVKPQYRYYTDSRGNRHRVTYVGGVKKSDVIIGRAQAQVQTRYYKDNQGNTHRVTIVNGVRTSDVIVQRGWQRPVNQPQNRPPSREAQIANGILQIINAAKRN